MSPAAIRATSSPKARAVIGVQVPSDVRRSMMGRSAVRAMRSASSHGTVQDESGSVMASLVAAPSRM